MTKCQKQGIISPLIFLSLIIVHSLASELSAEQLFPIKIANVSDWVLEQHLDRGKDRWDEKDDTFPGIGMALDNGIIDTSVWWGDKDHIERSSLAEKRVVLLEEKMRELYPSQEHVKMKGCEPPSKEMGWNICTVDFEGLKGAEDLIFEVGGGYKPYEQQLAYVGVRNPSGEIERISVRKEAVNEYRKKVAFIITQSEFSFYLARSDAKSWFENKIPVEYDVGFMVIERDKNYHLDTDRCILKVHLDRDELKKRGVKNIEVVLGWRDREVRNFPPHDIWGGRDWGNLGNAK